MQILAQLVILMSLLVCTVFFFWMSTTGSILDISPFLHIMVAFGTVLFSGLFIDFTQPYEKQNRLPIFDFPDEVTKQNISTALRWTLLVTSLLPISLAVINLPRTDEIHIDRALALMIGCLPFPLLLWSMLIWPRSQSWVEWRRNLEAAQELETLKEQTGIEPVINVNPRERLMKLDTPDWLLYAISGDEFMTALERVEKITDTRILNAAQYFVDNGSTTDYIEFNRRVRDFLIKYNPSTEDPGLFHSRADMTREKVQFLIDDFAKLDRDFSGTELIHATHYANGQEKTPAFRQSRFKTQMALNCEKTKTEKVKKYKDDDYRVAFLKHTPLLDLSSPMTAINLRERNEHTLMIGGSGEGKSHMLQHIIAHDLLSDEPCTVVVIDSQGALIPDLADSNIPLDRVAHINPEWSPGLNLFDLDYSQITDPDEQQKAENRAIELIKFVISGTLKLGYSDYQGTTLVTAIRLTLRTPGGTIYTLKKILESDDLDDFREFIPLLDEDDQEMLLDLWMKDNRVKTARTAMGLKIRPILQNSFVKRMLVNPESNIDFYRELQERDLILLDTSQNTLGSEAPSGFLGRVYLAMILQTVFQRVKDMKAGKTLKPVYLVVDEAHEYLDQSTRNLILQARKGFIGMTIATQSIKEMETVGMKFTTVEGSTATKFAATRSVGDAKLMGEAMDVPYTAIKSLPKYTWGYQHQVDGFVPVRASPNPLASFGFRKDKRGFKEEMIQRYRAAPTSHDPMVTGGFSNPPRQPDDGSGSKQNKKPPPDDAFDLGDVGDKF